MSNGNAIIAAIVVATALVTTFILFGNEHDKRLAEQAAQNPATRIAIGQSIYHANKFDFEGHEYVMITHSQRHGFTAVHYLNCVKCNAVPVKLEKGLK
jgi:hypothetical protein